MANVSLKGTRDGVTVITGEGPWDKLLEELHERLHTTASFFRGARVTLEVGERLLTEDDLRALEEILGQFDMGLYIISAQAKETRTAARRLDLRAVSSEPLPVPDTSAAGPIEEGSEGGLLVRRTIRSGQAIQHPGHVVIIGDVNPGAEVIAGGDIVVWGRLRGVVHAGALGDDTAVVCALQLHPTQLRIGNHIARAPDDRRKRAAVPEIAFVGREGIVAEPWNAVISELMES